MQHSFSLRKAMGALALLAASGLAGAQPTLGAEFSLDYDVYNLGAVTNVPARYGGLTFLNASTLLLGGEANGVGGAVYAATVLRDATGHVSSIGPAKLYASAPQIDGGLTFGPGGVLLFSGYPGNTIGQLLPNSTVPDVVTAVGNNRVTGSLGSLLFVPEGYAGAGQLKVLSYNTGNWQTLPYSVTNDGTLSFGEASAPIPIGGGPEGAAYVPLGSTGFGSPSVLVSEYGMGRVVAYEVDGSGDPIVSTRRVLLTGLSGAEGAAIDPATGDFFFSTFGSGNQVVRVSGFAAPVPEPEGWAMLIAGLACVGAIARRRRTASPAR